MFDTLEDRVVPTVPTVYDLSFSVHQGQTLNVAAANGLLGADSDPSLTLTIVTTPTRGFVDLANDGSFTYAPLPGDVGTDSFAYQVSDGLNNSNTATVTINVTDTAPVAIDHTWSVDAGQALTESAGSGLLSGASDADGDTLVAQLVSFPTRGDVDLADDGSFTYTPYPGDVGADSFAYQAFDGAEWSSVQTVTINVLNVVTLTSPGDQTNYDGDSVDLPLSATDAFGNTISYSESNLPPGLSIDSNTGIISGTIASNADASGPYAVTLTATDSSLWVSASQTINWVVTNPVSLNNPGDQTNYDGDSVALPLSATDALGNGISYSESNLPPGLSLDPTSGIISGTIASDADLSGPYSVTLTATDSAVGASASQLINWTVNWAPTFTATDPPTTDASGDPNGTAITVSSWASLNPGGPSGSYTPTYTVINVSNADLFTVAPAVGSDGTLTYTIAPYVYGTSTFSVKVENAGVTSAAQTFTIAVQNSMPNFPVTTETGTGNGSLYAAITQANNQAPRNLLVTFDLAAGVNTINLGSALPPITGNITITGPATQLYIYRDSTTPFRIFTAQFGSTVSISNLSLAFGLAPADGGSTNQCGGAILNKGTMDLYYVNMSDSQASVGGGAIANGSSGVLVMQGCGMCSNSATKFGGAVYNISGRVTISDATDIANNSAGIGGGVFNGDTMTIDSGTQIYSNSANGGSGWILSNGDGGGGGIFTDLNSTLTMTNVTVSSNSSLNGGGGLFSRGASTLYSVVISNNAATDGTNGAGGGIYVSDGITQTVTGCTVSGNTSGWYSQSNGAYVVWGAYLYKNTVPSANNTWSDSVYWAGE